MTAAAPTGICRPVDYRTWTCDLRSGLPQAKRRWIPDQPFYASLKTVSRCQDLHNFRLFQFKRRIDFAICAFGQVLDSLLP